MEKQASNFELNVLKLGVHTFQLMKGDRFESNGSYFHYVPCKENTENRGKGKYRRWQGRSNEHSCVKYEKDVKRADNIKMIVDEVLSVGANGKEHRKQVWEVQYAYKVEQPKNENIVLLSIELGGKYGDRKDQQWEFKTEELEVKRVTAENYFLEKHNPYSYHSQIPKKDMNIVHSKSGNYYVMTLMEDYNEAELLLFKHVEQSINEKIEHGHEIVRVQTENLSKFQLLKSKQGY